MDPNPPPTNKERLLYVDVIAGKGLLKMDFVGESDPYCKLRLVDGAAAQEQHTDVFHFSTLQ